MVESKAKGIFNATGPPDGLTMNDLVTTSAQESDKAPEFVWVDDDFLLEHEVVPFQGFPLWIPEGEEHRGFFSVSCERAFREGLTCRPLSETITDTLGWDRSRSRGGHIQALHLP